jgi:hypothetical protein
VLIPTMTNTPKKRLHLDRENVLALDPATLAAVHGGEATPVSAMAICISQKDSCLWCNPERKRP